MPDRITAQQRSRLMSRIRGRNTKPELVVRRYLWQLGYRYRVCYGKLPGRPDIVLSKLRVAIFVNGCFWHGHKSHAMTIPKSNTGYWRDKISHNQDRDVENGIKLRRMGWTVITIWECQLTPRLRQQTLERLAETLRLLGGMPYRRREYDYQSVEAEPQHDYGLEAADPDTLYQ